MSRVGLAASGSGWDVRWREETGKEEDRIEGEERSGTHDFLDLIVTNLGEEGIYFTWVMGRHFLIQSQKGCYCLQNKLSM